MDTAKRNRKSKPEPKASSRRPTPKIAESRQPLTAPDLVAAKGKRRLVMITAFDEPSARTADAAGVDVVLVGDSLAMAVLGRPDTLSVTLAEMIHHTRAAAVSVKRALLVADMPFGSFQVSVPEAVRNACRLVAEGGAKAVKLEGPRPKEVAAIAAAGVPVVGHLGLTPQSLHRLGGYRVQGRQVEQAVALVEQARALEAAGAFMIVLEAIPVPLGAAVTRAVKVPTIGIGAGPHCDGQVLVWADVLGLAPAAPPRFVRRYAALAEEAERAIARFAADVRAQRYPSEQECYATPSDFARALDERLRER